MKKLAIWLLALLILGLPWAVGFIGFLKAMTEVCHGCR